MIKIDNASKIIKKKTVLKHVTTTFETGNCYLLKGHNGCGKTMLLRLICGLISPTQGTVTTTGNPKFGVIIEHPQFMENESALYSLEYLAKIQDTIGRDDIMNSLAQLNLDNHANEKVKTFSLGMKQRLSICQAIIENPDVLLLDEPLNALDEKNTKCVWDILDFEKEKGKIIIIAAHSLDADMLSHFDHILTMHEGELEFG